jgi:hypothetical protein
MEKFNILSGVVQTKMILYTIVLSKSGVRTKIHWLINIKENN